MGGKNLTPQVFNEGTTGIPTVQRKPSVYSCWSRKKVRCIISAKRAVLSPVVIFMSAGGSAVSSTDYYFLSQWNEGGGDRWCITRNTGFV